MADGKKAASSRSATLLGLLAIVFWSTSVGFTRSLAEKLGPVTSSACIYTGSGLIGCAFLALTGRLRGAFALPRSYLLGCGALFVGYLVPFCLAIGWAKNAQQVVEIGLLNYLWPALTLVFSIPILKHRARPWLVPGIVLALAGIYLATLGQQPLTADTLASAWRGFFANVAGNPWAYGFALITALAWSLYSNLSRRLAGGCGGTAVPIFLVAAGLALGALRLFVAEEGSFSFDGVLELLYMMLFPALLAYLFWDLAVRSGSMILVASLSYLIPLFSTLILCLLQEIPMGLNLWFGCALLVAGAVVCKLSIRERPER